MKKKVCILVGILLLFLSGCAMKKTESMTITFFDAGKADAILIETDNGAVMIDAGLSDNSEDLLQELQKRGIQRLDALIITHFDQDHVGGADTLVENLEIDHVYTTYDSKSSSEVDSFEQALTNSGLSASVITGQQRFSIDDVQITMYGAKGGYEEDESNNSSLIVLVSYGSFDGLFMGDAEDERIEEFLTYYEVEADLLKVPYHGHYTDGLELLLERMEFKDAVITNGDDNPAKKEIKKTVALLEDAGTTVWQTKNGTIIVTCENDSYTVKQSDS